MTLRPARTAFLLLFSLPLAHAKWITAWTGSVQGPYPSGNASAQPVLTAVFPSPEVGARDQGFRLIIKPDVWGRRARIRLSNALGTKAVTFDGAYAGLQLSGAAIVSGTNRPATFGGKPSVTIPPGESAWSDPIALNFAGLPPTSLTGRKLAVSFHIVGESGPMTWHAKALTTSYPHCPRQGRTAGRRTGCLERRGGRNSFPVQHDVLVFPQRSGHGCAQRRAPRCCVWRFHHRWHSLHAEWRRPLARRSLAPSARGLGQPRRGRERGHRRQSRRGPAGIHAAKAVRRWTIRRHAPGARRA